MKKWLIPVNFDGYTVLVNVMIIHVSEEQYYHRQLCTVPIKCLIFYSLHRSHHSTQRQLCNDTDITQRSLEMRHTNQSTNIINEGLVCK
jgi:hypothetical protein